MRPVDRGAFTCMCRLVGFAQMGPERCTYELKPQQLRAKQINQWCNRLVRRREINEERSPNICIRVLFALNLQTLREWAKFCRCRIPENSGKIQ